MSNIKTYKLRSLFNIGLFLLLILVIFVTYAIYHIMTNDLFDGETDELMKFQEKLIMCIMISIVVFTWLISLVLMLRQKFIVKKAYSLTNEGIEGVLLGGIFLAFIIVVPVKLIPWKCIKLDKENALIKINTERIPNAFFLVKLILKFKGLDLKMVDEDFISFYDKYTSKMENTFDESNLLN